MWLINRIRNWWARRFSPRPLYWGEVELAGKKGVNHLTTHRVEHDLPLSVFDQLVTLARGAGVQMSRGPHIAPWCRQKRGHMQKLRVMVEMMQYAGITPVPLIAPDATTTEDGWRRHCAEVARGLPVTSFEIMNEPDNDRHWEPKRYAHWLTIASDAIRTVKPTARIVAPGLGHGKAWSAADFLGALDLDSFDVLSVHLYDQSNRRLTECLRLIPDKLAWVTEDGATRHVEAAIRGSYRTYLQEPRLEALFWYCLWNPDDPQYSLIERDSSGFRCKPAFEVFKGIR